MCAVVFFFPLFQLFQFNSESISEPVIFFLYSLLLLVKRLTDLSLSPSLSAGVQVMCSVVAVLRLDLQWSLATMDETSPSRVSPYHSIFPATHLFSLTGSQYAIVHVVVCDTMQCEVVGVLWAFCTIKNRFTFVIPRRVMQGLTELVVS